MNIKSLLVATSLAALCAQPCRAVLIAYEGFNYPAGTVTPANGGTGWSGSWETLEIGTPGSTYSNLTVSGNRFYKTNAAVFDKSRGLSTTLGNTDQTVWFSLLAELDGTQNGAIGFRQDFTTVLSIGAGDWWSPANWGMYQGGNYATGTTAASNLTFLVMRIDFSASGNESIYLWTNPALGSTPDISSANVQLVNSGNFYLNRITLYANTNRVASYDEFRIGTTYADVAPINIPEPSTGLLVGLGLMGGLGVARRRRVTA